MIIRGDCIEALKTLEANSVDALVTDPPAGISFMGKDWDDDKGGRKQWTAWMESVMRECLRVLKPGAHGLVWALPRTSHWTATALEDAGFEIRDVVMHLFGSGFPKSHNIEKATGDSRFTGWGTALKPAAEHWILVRKPLSEKTVAANVLKHGTGGLNIEASRIEAADQAVLDAAVKRMTGNVVRQGQSKQFLEGQATIQPNSAQGRFPSHLILDEEAAAALDAQSGNLKGPGNTRRSEESNSTAIVKFNKRSFSEPGINNYPGQEGGASRFFYVAKASKKDKGAENSHPTVKGTALMTYLIKLITPSGGLVLDCFAGSGSTGVSALQNGFKFIGIERDDSYAEIAERRILNCVGDAHLQTEMVL